MALESKVIERFIEGSCSILQEDELKSWWGNDDLSKLHQCLQTMVNNGSLGTRTVSTGSTETTLYWLKTKDQPIVATPSNVRPTGGSLGQRLKRSRPSFVPPMLSNSTSRASDKSGAKRQKLNLTPSYSQRKQTIPSGDVSGSTARGKLDFSAQLNPITDTTEQMVIARDCDTSSVAAVDKIDSLNHGNPIVPGEQLKTLLRERDSLQMRLTEKKEELRKLRMVKMYRTKDELQGLDQLIIRWREVAQEVAETLLESSTSEPRPSMKQLLDYLHIDCTLIRYSIEDESFY